MLTGQSGAALGAITARKIERERETKTKIKTKTNENNTETSWLDGAIERVESLRQTEEKRWLVWEQQQVGRLAGAIIITTMAPQSLKKFPSNSLRPRLFAQLYARYLDCFQFWLVYLLLGLSCCCCCCRSVWLKVEVVVSVVNERMWATCFFLGGNWQIFQVSSLKSRFFYLHLLLLEWGWGFKQTNSKEHSSEEASGRQFCREANLDDRRKVVVVMLLVFGSPTNRATNMSSSLMSFIVCGSWIEVKWTKLNFAQVAAVTAMSDLEPLVAWI